MKPISQLLDNEYITGVLSSLAAALIVAVIAYVFRAKVKRIFTGATLKARSNTPSLSLEVENVKNQRDQWITIFIIKNSGSIDAAKLRVFLCSYSLISHSLNIKRVEIESQRKYVDENGQTVVIRTLSLHEGCPATEDQRYFVEFIDGNDGTIYRASKGVPNVKDGSMAFYGTIVCRKRLPRKGLKSRGDLRLEKVVKKYEIDLAAG